MKFKADERPYIACRAPMQRKLREPAIKPVTDRKCQSFPI